VLERERELELGELGLEVAREQAEEVEEQEQQELERQQEEEQHGVPAEANSSLQCQLYRPDSARVLHLEWFC